MNAKTLATVLSGLAATLIVALGPAGDAAAQSSAFGELFPSGQLAAVGNCDALRAGEGASALNNPAHAAWGTRWSFGGGYRRLYELEYLQRVWAAAKYRYHRWGAAVSLTRFGKEEFYTETEAALACAARLMRGLAAGIELRNLRLAYTPDDPSYDGWSLGWGVIWNPVAALTASGSIRNALRQNFVPASGLPRQYRLSAAANLPGKVQVGAGWAKNEGDRAILGLGQKIGVAQNLNFLSAVYFNPARYALGAEFVLRGQSISYTYLSHPDLGGTHYVEFAIGGMTSH